MRKNVIVACDFPGRAETLAFLDAFTGQKPFVKIGMELFYAEGPSVVREIKARGHQIFLDLKLHDIPNTVRGAARSLARLGADMVNVHAAGGHAMMKAALEGLQDGARGACPALIAVTLLTSISQEMMRAELLIPGSLGEVVASYAAGAQAAGLDGVVCSPLEVRAVKDWCGPEFLTVTPGIRYPEGGNDDQQRVTTPQRAAALGSDYIVVGRCVTADKDPAAAYARVLAEFSGAQACAEPVL